MPPRLPILLALLTTAACLEQDDPSTEHTIESHGDVIEPPRPEVSLARDRWIMVDSQIRVQTSWAGRCEDVIFGSTSCHRQRYRIFLECNGVACDSSYIDGTATGSHSFTITPRQTGTLFITISLLNSTTNERYDHGVGPIEVVEPETVVTECFAGPDDRPCETLERAGAGERVVVMARHLTRGPSQQPVFDSNAEPSMCGPIDAFEIAPQRYSPGEWRHGCVWENPPSGELSFEARFGDSTGQLTLQLAPVALDQPGQSPN